MMVQSSDDEEEDREVPDTQVPNVDVEEGRDKSSGWEVPDTQDTQVPNVEAKEDRDESSGQEHKVTFIPDTEDAIPREDSLGESVKLSGVPVTEDPDATIEFKPGNCLFRIWHAKPEVQEEPIEGMEHPGVQYFLGIYYSIIDLTIKYFLFQAQEKI